MKDVTLGSHNFRTIALTTTIIAIQISDNSLFLYLLGAYMYGTLKILSAIGIVFRLILNIHILAFRIQEFLDKVSIANIASSVCDRKFGYITAISLILVSTRFMAAEVKVFSFIFNCFFNIDTMYTTILHAGLVFLVFTIFTAVIGLILHTMDSHLNSNTLTIYIIDKYSFIGLKELTVIGISGMLMSTAGSYINTAVITVASNICKLLGIPTWYNEPLISKIFSIFIGLVGMSRALYTNALLQLIFFVQSFYAPIVVVPILMAIIREPGGWIALKNCKLLDAIKEQYNTAVLNFCYNLPKSFTLKNILSYCNDDTHRSKHYYITYLVFSISSLLLMAFTSDSSIRNNCAKQQLEQIVHITKILLCSLVGIKSVLGITKQQSTIHQYNNYQI